MYYYFEHVGRTGLKPESDFGAMFTAASYASQNIKKLVLRLRPKPKSPSPRHRKRGAPPTGNLHSKHSDPKIYGALNQ